MKSKINIIIIIAFICAVSSVIMMIVIINRSSHDKSYKNNTVNYSYADFIPPEFEKNALEGIPNVEKDLDYSEIDAQAFKFSICGKPVLESSDLIIFLSNPKENKVWLKVRVYSDKDVLLGETGIIKPNEYVKQVSLSGCDSKAIKYKIMAYEPETYYSEGSAVLNTAIAN